MSNEPSNSAASKDTASANAHKRFVAKIHAQIVAHPDIPLRPNIQQVATAFSVVQDKHVDVVRLIMNSELGADVPRWRLGKKVVYDVEYLAPVIAEYFRANCVALERGAKAMHIGKNRAHMEKSDEDQTEENEAVA